MTATDHGAFTEVDRLVDAIKEQPEEAVVTYHHTAFAAALFHQYQRQHERNAQAHAPTRLWHRLRRRPIASDEQVAKFAALAEAQSARETALRALALAALDRLKDDSVESLADILDRSVEELEESRQQAAQVEGEREPDDPFMILKVLPEDYHEQFLYDYREALRAAYPAEGYLALRRMLKRWAKTAEALSDPAYQAEAERSRRAIETGDFSGYATMNEVFRSSKD
ncbi:MAG: DUF6247 family protein [Nocardiopsaceae bacterium]|jgi:hypothetical protein|nr:DUF6247 family protein [Nocardiopsaceae bacterium]